MRQRRGWWEMYFPTPQRIGLCLLCVALGVAFLADHKDALHAQPFADIIGERILPGSKGSVNDLFVAGSLGILVVLALRAGARRLAIRAVAAWLAVTAFIHIVKFTTGNLLHLFPRPSGGVGGLPSGHTAAACTLAYLLTERLPRLAVLWWGLAALIAWSRTESGGHYAYQILAGAVLGIAVGVGFAWRFPAIREVDTAMVALPDDSVE